MKKIIRYFIIVLMASIAVSCAQKFETEEDLTIQESSASNRHMLKFTSAEGFANIVEQLKMMDATDIKQLPRSRTSDIEIAPEQFISLRQSLIDQGLRSFTDAELTEIIQDSLEYEPEDSLIVDPYMMCLLNENREVQIDDHIYKYVDEGVVIYDAVSPTIFNADAIIIDSLQYETLRHGEMMSVEDNKGVQAELVALTYNNNDSSLDHEFLEKYRVIEFTDRFDTGGGGEIIGYNPIDNNDELSVTLVDGVNIPANLVKRLTYKKGDSVGSWLNELSNNLFGLNLTISNKFDSRHRMKLRLYSQDYWIYQATGMSVRMQKRVLGIWWRKKAQEFRYGWSAMECKYSFTIPPFKDPTPTPEAYTYGKYPTAMRKNFPFAKKDIILFHIPIANYDLTTGDLNKVFKKGIQTMQKQIEKWLVSESHQKYKVHPWGLYTYKPSNENKLIVVYPQGEESATGKGREVVKWDAGWFTGTYMLGYTSSMSGDGFSFNDFEFDIDKPSKVETIRGCVHAAVKFDNEWRACVIQTK